MRTSQFKKINKDILLEWVYDDSNIIIDSYSILTNNRDVVNSYIGGSLTINNLNNQLFPIDVIQRKWAVPDTGKFNFLAVNDYTQSGVRHDTIKLYLPSNWDFAEYIGLFIRAYTYDFNNNTKVYLTNFYFDKNNTTHSSYITSPLPPYLYDDRLWDRTISLNIPSPKALGLQRTNGLATSNSINYNLTSNGLSQTAPTIVEFYFITGVQQVGNNTYYTTNNPYIIEVPQDPELSELSLFIEESINGDFFEIYGIYNLTFENFYNYIEQSKSLGRVYVVEYTITVFEQNVKQKETKFTVTEDFSDVIEFRPIIKYSTSSASLQVELRLINKVDDSVITRNAIYGLKPEQISKYCLNLKKINIQNAFKPKIYVRKSLELSELDSINKNPVSETIVIVDYPNLINIDNISCASPNSLYPKSENTLDNYYTNGMLKIIINPFDNILKFTIATKDKDKLEFLDMTNCQNLKISFKSELMNLEFQTYTGDGNNPKLGMCVFKVPQSSYLDLKNLWTQGETFFYITTTNKNVKTLIYSGQFVPSESNEVKKATSDNFKKGQIKFINADKPTATATAKKIKKDDIGVGVTSTSDKSVEPPKPDTNKFNIDPKIFETKKKGFGGQIK